MMVGERVRIGAAAQASRFGRWGVVGAAALAAVLVWVVAAPVGGAELVVGSGGTGSTVGVVTVLVASLLVGALAVALRVILDRHTADGRRNWTVVAAIVWLISFAGPLSARSVAAGVALACMHLAVGAVLIAGIRRVPDGRG